MEFLAILGALGVMLLAGLAGIVIGVAWDSYVTAKGWRGWYFPDE